MRKLTSKEKILLIAIALLLGLFAIKNFVLGPIYEKTALLADEIEQSKMAIRKYLVLEHNRTEILKAQKQIDDYTLVFHLEVYMVHTWFWFSSRTHLFECLSRYTTSTVLSFYVWSRE